MQKNNLLVISGSTRPNNNTVKAANFVYNTANLNNNFDCKLIDITSISVSDDGNTRDKEYSNLVSWADAYFIVTPEYNHGVPGGLKRVLDSEPNEQYNKKAVAIAGVSSGSFGGIRGVESLVPIVREYGMLITKTDAYFSNVNAFFSDNDQKVIEHQKQRITKVLDELLFLSKILKWGKLNLSK